MKNIDMLFSELAQYKRIHEETEAMIDSIQDEIKAYMLHENKDCIIGSEHKATYKAFTSERFDSRKLKAVAPMIYAKYVKSVQGMRFNFY